jgi:hypothetical protein
VVALAATAAIGSTAGCGAGARQSAAQTSARPSQPPRSEQLWVEVRTPHFVLSTDQTRERALRTAKQLEEIRAMLLTAAWPKASDPMGRTQVVVFARPADFDRYTGLPAAVAGVSINRSGVERTIAFSPGAQGGIPRVAVHELAHDLLSWFLPLHPTWLAEGMAVYLENTHLDASGAQVVMGEASEKSLRWLTQTRIFLSTERLFESTSPHSVDLRDVASFYAGAWFLVCFLLNEEPERFGIFQKRLHQLVPWRRAWDEAFDGMTVAELDRRMTLYAEQGGRFLVLSADVRMPAVEASLRELSPAEAHGVKARLANAVAPELAAREAGAALALDDSELGALSVRFHTTNVAALELRRGLAARAVAAHPDAAEAWFLMALAAEDAQARDHALQRATALDADHVGLALLNAEQALERGDAEVALERVRFVVRRSALSPAALAVYVAALGRAGHCREAVSVAETGAQRFGASCRVPGATGELLQCAAYVQLASQRHAGLCGSKPAATRAVSERPHRARQQAAQR